MKRENRILIGLLASSVMWLFPGAASLWGAPNEPAQPAGRSAAIPLDQVGAVAGQQYSGDGLAVIPTAEGGHLHCVFQKLEGEATSEGLWLISTVTNTRADHFQVKAVAVGRTSPGPSAGNPQLSTRLLATGSITIDGQRVRFARPGLAEEYSTSMDGVRQDFVVTEPPQGAGKLQVCLEVIGAQVERTAGGAQLVLVTSGRKIAYSRLRAIDATGRELPARMEVLTSNSESRKQKAEMAVVVNDAGAVYPVRIDPTFRDANWVSLGGSVPGVNGTVHAMVIDASGNLYIGGSFTAADNVLASSIAKWDGSSWSALGSGVNGPVGALAVSGSDLYAAGAFTNAGGVAANCIARWDGSSWSALGSGMSGGFYPYVDALAVSGGNLYVGGWFTDAGGVVASNIAKWDGSGWSALGSGVNGPVGALAVSGSDLYAGGSFAYAGGILATNIARWDGSGWSALGSGIYDPVFALALSDGEVFAGSGGVEWGPYPEIDGGGTYGYVDKWDGSTWLAVGSRMDEEVFVLAMSGSDVYAGGGGFYDPGIWGQAPGSQYGYLAKLDGSNWSELGSMVEWPYGDRLHFVDLSVSALALSGSNLYAGGFGFFTTAGGIPAYCIAKWGGSNWSALGSGTSGDIFGGSARALALSGSDLYAGGEFGMAGGVAANHISKWDGSGWSALGSGINGWVSALAVSGGNLYVGGWFTDAGGVVVSNIAKWDGSGWSALGLGMDGPVWALVVSGSDLYAGGWFTRAGGAAATNIAKWDGSSWSALDSGLNGPVRALAVSGSNLYAGGEFTGAGGIPANYVAKWDGSSWSGLGSGVNYYGVYALAVSGSNVYAGGEFWMAGDVAADAVAKWDGSVWSALGSGMVYGEVYALALAGSNLYAGGEFTTAGGIAADCIAKWDGSSWSALGSGVGGDVRALAVSGSELYAGGFFTTAGGKVSPYLAKAIVNPGNWLKLQLGVPGPHTNTLNYVGVPNTPYLLQFATNLTTSPWFTLATNTPPANGRGTVQDPTATDPQRFYRVSEP